MSLINLYLFFFSLLFWILGIPPFGMPGIAPPPGNMHNPPFPPGVHAPFIPGIPPSIPMFPPGGPPPPPHNLPPMSIFPPPLPPHLLAAAMNNQVHPGLANPVNPPQTTLSTQTRDPRKR